MKKLFSLLLVINIFALTLHAQNSLNAQIVLDKASNKIQSSKGINVTFFLTQKDKYGHAASASQGILKIKGSKYYVKEESNEIFSNGVQVWNYDGQTEVTVSKVDNDNNELSPQQIITGFDKKDFDIKLVSSAGANYQIELIPVDKRKNFKQIILSVNKTSNLISKAVITDKTNAVTEISFSNIALNAVIPDTQFAFDVSKHPGVEIVNQ